MDASYEEYIWLFAPFFGITFQPSMEAGPDIGRNDENFS